MLFRNWLPLLALIGSAGVSAQPPAYGPPAVPPGFGPFPMPYGSGAYPEMPEMRSFPVSPAAPQSGAEPAASAPPVEASTGLPPGPAGEAMAVVREGMDRLMGFLSASESRDRAQVATFLDRAIAPYFDFAYMAQWVAGPAYRTMSPAQQQALAARIEADFLGTLATQLMGYQGQQIRLLAPRMGPRGAVSVNVGLLRPGTYPSKLEFRLYRSDSGWRVYDVVADGQSAAAYYRVQFQRMAGQGAAPPGS